MAADALNLYENFSSVDPWTMLGLGVQIPNAVRNLHVTFDSPQT